MRDVGHQATILATLLLANSYPALGYIKCYCNLPECDGSGNICTSYMDFCFSKIHMNSAQNSPRNSSEPTEDTHGCVENLPQTDTLDAQTCDGTGVAVRRTPGGSPLLYCCTGDMCNYEEKNEKQDTVEYIRYNSTDFPSEETTHTFRRLSKSHEETVLQVAVIAVPAAGSLILIVLIFLAVKMLKGDRRNVYFEQSGSKKSLGFIPYFKFKKSCRQSINPKQSNVVENQDCSQPLNNSLNYPHSAIAGVHNSLLVV